MLFPNAVLYNDFLVLRDNELLQSDVVERTPTALKKVARTECPIGFTGIWIPVKHLKAIPFPEHIDVCEDYWWMLEAMEQGIEFRGVMKQLHIKRYHGNSTTAAHQAELESIKQAIIAERKM